METKDILENQPWTLIEDEMLGEPIDNQEDDDKVITVPAKSQAPQPKQQRQENPFRIIAEELGFEVEDNWDGDADEFKNVLFENAQKQLVEKFDDPVVAGFINYVSKGGNPTQFIQAISGPNISSMNDEDVYIAYMRSTTSFNDDKIKKLMERSKDLDEFDDEVASFKAELAEAQDEQIQEVVKRQEEELKAREMAARQAQVKRKQLVKSKEILGVPIIKNSEFERFYLHPSERIEFEGKVYNITPYQKRLIDRQNNPIDYEALMAYLEFIDFKLPTEETLVKNKTVSSLKDRLSGLYNGTTTRLIDET